VEHSLADKLTEASLKFVNCSASDRKADDHCLSWAIEPCSENHRHMDNSQPGREARRWLGHVRSRME
jgi:hypothetical protein